MTKKSSTTPKEKPFDPKTAKSTVPSLILKLDKDHRQTLSQLSKAEARFLVNSYYQTQNDRIRAGAQVRELKKEGKGFNVILWNFHNHFLIEKQLKTALKTYSESDPLGQRLMSVCGIGEVLAAGLLAHLDISRAPTAGHFWSYAGLNPKKKWLGREKSNSLMSDVMGTSKVVTLEHVDEISKLSGWKVTMIVSHGTDKNGKLNREAIRKFISIRPWNANLKSLCWKIGESFVKVSRRPQDFYGKLYLQRKQYEIDKNENGDYEEQAADGAARVGKSTDAYKHYSEGKLSPGHLYERSKRWAVKIFLAHVHEMMYKDLYKTEAPTPYAISFLDHAHFIVGPDSLVGGFDLIKKVG